MISPSTPPRRRSGPPLPDQRLEMSTLLRAPEPGVYPNIPFAEYLAWDCASASQLKDGARSWAWCRQQRLNPKPATPALELGAAIHAAVLEPDKFEAQYRLRPAGDGRTTAVRLARENLIALGLTLLAEKDWETCRGIQASADANEAVCNFFEQIEAIEVSVVADLTLPNGMVVRCKARPDALGPAARIVGDLKSSRDASPHRFGRDIYSLGYYISAALYIDVLAAAGIPVDSFLFLACEKEPPYQFATYRLVPAAIERGRTEYQELLAAWAVCHSTGVWPGYPQQFVDIDIPGYGYGTGAGVDIDFDDEDEDEEDEDEEEEAEA